MKIELDTEELRRMGKSELVDVLLSILRLAGYKSKITLEPSVDDVPNDRKTITCDTLGGMVEYPYHIQIIRQGCGWESFEGRFKDKDEAVSRAEVLVESPFVGMVRVIDKRWSSQSGAVVATFPTTS